MEPERREDSLTDAHDVILDQRNLLERLVQRIPGFRGYSRAENRREADRALRDFGVQRLDGVVSSLHDQIKRSPLEEMQELHAQVSVVEKIRNELRHADLGYSGFFSEIKWDTEKMLDAVYRFDEQVVESVMALAISVESGDLSAGDLKQELRALDRSLAERRSSILGLFEPSGD